mmetsp:Transcript_34358/g.55340  ORF Transcript_34358/g.55340 Transcript_34358/m.55340 type:complete len:394 (-) Transcript_34358:189-1370(-)
MFDDKELKILPNKSDSMSIQYSQYKKNSLRNTKKFIISNIYNKTLLKNKNFPFTRSLLSKFLYITKTISTNTIHYIRRSEDRFINDFQETHKSFTKQNIPIPFPITYYHTIVNMLSETQDLEISPIIGTHLSLVYLKSIDAFVLKAFQGDISERHIKLVEILDQYLFHATLAITHKPKGVSFLYFINHDPIIRSLVNIYKLKCIQVFSFADLLLSIRTILKDPQSCNTIFYQGMLWLNKLMSTNKHGTNRRNIIKIFRKGVTLLLYMIISHPSYLKYVTNENFSFQKNTADILLEYIVLITLPAYSRINLGYPSHYYWYKVFPTSARTHVIKSRKAPNGQGTATFKTLCKIVKISKILYKTPLSPQILTLTPIETLNNIVEYTVQKVALRKNF